MLRVDVPMTCSTCAEKMKIIRQTKQLLEQNILID
jgi:hypothetical protein